MDGPRFESDSRLMLFAPHPDDESLGCGTVLQRAVRAGATIRIVYATDGEDNPWPQRVLERKWRLHATDRGRWGALRRKEALAALRVLGIDENEVNFLGLPDQNLTQLLLRDCGPVLKRLAATIRKFEPTHLLVPSLADTHPDHSALAVMLRLVLRETCLAQTDMRAWAYAVHGKSAAFFQRAHALRLSRTEVAIKRRAIACHRTQIRLSRRRFFAYANRPERFLTLSDEKRLPLEGSIASFLREPDRLRLKTSLSPKAMRPSQSTLFVLGQRKGDERMLAVALVLPARSCDVEIVDCKNRECVGAVPYCGNGFAGEMAIPAAVFSPAQPLFVKLERRSWFFDETGWIHVAPLPFADRSVVRHVHGIEEPVHAIR